MNPWLVGLPWPPSWDIEGENDIPRWRPRPPPAGTHLVPLADLNAMSPWVKQHAGHVETLYMTDIGWIPSVLNMLTALRALWLCKCPLLVGLSLGGLPWLQDLRLWRCDALAKLPPSIRALQALRRLHLMDCDKLTDVTEIARLGALKVLMIKACPVQRLELHWLQPVTKLTLLECGRLTALPDPLCTTLKSLGIVECRALETLPTSLSGLPHLTDITIEHSHLMSQLPDLVCPSLTALRLINMDALSGMPERLASSLTELVIRPCAWVLRQRSCIQEWTHYREHSRLLRLPTSLGALTRLTSLDLSTCYLLTSLPDEIGCLTSLLELDLSNCEELTVLPETITKLGALEVLNLARCTHLRALPEFLGALRALETLDIENCERLRALPISIGQLCALEEFCGKGCHALAVIPETFGHLGALTFLSLSECFSLAKLPETFGQLTRLQTLHVDLCAVKVLPTSLDRLCNLTNLLVPFELWDKAQRIRRKCLAYACILVQVMADRRRRVGLPSEIWSLVIDMI